MASTGRAVAGGISTAKGVFSSWMSSLKTNPGSGPEPVKDDQEIKQSTKDTKEQEEEETPTVVES